MDTDGSVVFGDWSREAVQGGKFEELERVEAACVADLCAAADMVYTIPREEERSFWQGSRSFNDLTDAEVMRVKQRVLLLTATNNRCRDTLQRICLITRRNSNSMLSNRVAKNFSRIKYRVFNLFYLMYCHSHLSDLTHLR